MIRSVLLIGIVLIWGAFVAGAALVAVRLWPVRSTRVEDAPEDPPDARVVASLGVLCVLALVYVVVWVIAWMRGTDRVTALGLILVVPPAVFVVLSVATIVRRPGALRGR